MLMCPGWANISLPGATRPWAQPLYWTQEPAGKGKSTRISGFPLLTSGSPTPFIQFLYVPSSRVTTGFKEELIENRSY